MQKISLPVIFVSAVVAALFYVSQEEHDTGTLLLLAAVLLVGQICATLPFIFESRRPRAGTDRGAGTPDANTQKIVANQQIIHEDLRSLGETLIKRLNAITERQDAVEKRLLAALAKAEPDFSDDLDAFREKLGKSLEERFEALDERLRESSEDGRDEDVHRKLDSIADRLEDFLIAFENLAPGELEDVCDDSGEEYPGSDADGESEDGGNADGVASVEDFPEDEGEFLASEDADSGAAASPVQQGEFELGDFPKAHGATLILEAMLGIGNKPFLRGNAPGLSDSAGTPMTFVEIGKWSYDFDALTEEITVRILRNDDENEPLGEPVTLSPGQTLELAYVPERT